MRELADWFRADDIFSGKVHYDEKPIVSSQMGGVIEAVVIAVGSGGAATTLVLQFFTWLRIHSERHIAHLTLKDGTGREVSLDIDGLNDSEAIARKAFDFFSGNSPK